jgi:PadR family transcriptional regulator PadR
MVKIGDAFIRSLEKPIILWLLSHKPRHGYELIAEFKRLTGRTLKPSIVYPFLHRLEKEGFASSQWAIKGKRKIRHYALTKNGEELLRKVRETFTKPFKEFLLEIIGENNINTKFTHTT